MTAARILLLLGLGLAASVTSVVALDADVLSAGSDTHEVVASGFSAPPPRLWAGRPRGDPWDDEQFLQREWDWTLAAVSWAVGVPFEERPLLRACTTEEYSAVNRGGALEPRRWNHLERTQSREGERPREYARHDHAIGFCAAEGGGVYLHPEGIRQCRESHRPDADVRLNELRLILVHEATHALDFQRHGYLFRAPYYGEVKTFRRNYLLEGHAWQITEVISRAYGWEEDYKSLLVLVFGDCAPVVDEETSIDVVWMRMGDIRDSYRMGRRLFRAAEKAGGRAVVEEMLAHAPRRELRTWPEWQRWLRTRTRRVRDGYAAAP